ncbi:MAG: type VI secretion system baseplate subunit TssE [Pseudomonadota bacterium]
MAELAAHDRLQPSLLERLTDNARDKSTESREERVVSVKQLRRSVLRDLGWLMNSRPLLSDEEAEQFPEVSKSVLNFGTVDVCGLTARSMRLEQLEQQLTNAIKDFEPRLIPASLNVDMTADSEAMNATALKMSIVGDLWLQPLPMKMFIHTEIDVENGNAILIEQ